MNGKLWTLVEVCQNTIFIKLVLNSHQKIHQINNGTIILNTSRIFFYFNCIKFFKDALLKLADIYFFGLKQQNEDTIRGGNLYRDAANLRQPEAMCFYAIFNHYTKVANKFNKMFLDPIPIDRISESDRVQLNYMWELMESAAALDWYCPFLIFHAKQAEKLHFLPI